MPGAVTPEPTWLRIARELKAIAQTGLTFSAEGFDRQRYERVRELAAMLLAQGSDTDFDSFLHLMRQENGYATPKVDVRGAAFVDGRILMVREISDGKWTLPGGWADVNQSAGECVAREIAEESGFTARVLKLAAVYDYQRSGHPPHHIDSIYKMFFLCEITGGAARASDETSEIAFFPRDELPPLSLGRTTAAQIERMFQHRETDLPTDFD
ncbi:MAG TPA: NUDIX hydrolase [Steroidobacteraceae bacterium]|jgi:ADP-ribose pyrophosphatase YjhB (NUDIX family)